ncbi:MULTISPECIES: sulfurtransferase complex subunit TusB [Methanothermobacter]|uniref:sulfurtransferase complex subunit TusB n=1 Tax=Methanothermobacter TaxID=145260 RepID=UPI001366B887|nr:MULTISPECIES: sulfurtransferase complex subunit TusB [Methanothermobacter]MDI6702629.1 sulfurtransferase complex subunit TusB [Methanothermobacter wolfeii]MDI6841846.1 sulfurtransferase complex subunit TusB [Methanothermobacter wolfeii]QHN07050.1 sulfurtransferase complex subunit TusB [Methanothermobacter sp. THM-1]
MGSVGFIVTKSPYELGFRTFIDLVRIWEKEDLHVYLISNGAYAAMKKNSYSHTIRKISGTGSVFARKEDLMARGIVQDMLIDGVGVIEGFDRIVVDVMENLEMVFTI